MKKAQKKHPGGMYTARSCVRACATISELIMVIDSRTIDVRCSRNHRHTLWLVRCSLAVRSHMKLIHLLLIRILMATTRGT